MSALLLALLAQAAPVATGAVRVEPGFELACHRVLDVDGDGRAEIVVFGRDGRVRTLAPFAPDAPQGELVLPAPARTLVTFATYAGRTHLVTLSPAGALAYPVLEGGVIGTQAQNWGSRARFQLRLGEPSLSNIAQDVNNDGVDDLVVPTLAGVELWLASLPEGAAAPSFRKAATLAVEISRSGVHEAEYLSDSLSGSLSIPGLLTRDVNGDGRPDLLVEQGQRRAFHLQRADGAFPVEPDIAVDLAIFRDTTEASSFQFGGTLSAGDSASWSSRDLDGDGIPDYVIGHRRKVWVFLGGREGPQFTQPSAILKTAEDITALVVHPLDADARPDLLLIKVQIPTLATLLRGLFSEWDVPVRVLGYANVGEGRFEGSPSLSNDLAVRLPGIIGLAKNPERVLERFTELEKQVRPSTRGDVDADGREDALLVSEDERRVEVWLERGNANGPDAGAERKIRQMLFDERDAVWDLDRMIAAFGGLAQRRNALITGGRPSDRALPLPDPEQVELVVLACADLGGPAGDELVVACKRKDDPRSGWFEVLSFAPEGK